MASWWKKLRARFGRLERKELKPVAANRLRMRGRVAYLLRMGAGSEQNVRSDRVWDIAIKLMVPAVLACASALVLHEVRLGTQETRLATVEGQVDRLPPEWLRGDIQEIKALLRDFDVRLRTLERDVAKK